MFVVPGLIVDSVGMTKMIENDMALALSSTKEGTAHNRTNGIKLTARYLTSFLKHFEKTEDTLSKLVISNLECYRVVFLTEVTDPNQMTEVADRYNKALEGEPVETLRDFVKSSSVPVIYLSSIRSCPNASSTLKKAIDFLFAPSPEGTSLLEFDMLQPESTYFLRTAFTKSHQGKQCCGLLEKLGGRSG